MLDLAYATGLRASEIVYVKLGMIDEHSKGDRWLHLVGKGSKAGKVALQPLAQTALDRYLVQRRLPITPSRWEPSIPLLGSLQQDSGNSTRAPRCGQS